MVQSHESAPSSAVCPPPTAARWTSIGPRLMAPLLILTLTLVACDEDEDEERQDTLQVAWVYSGPPGDYGWSLRHEIARKSAEGLYPEIKTVSLDNVTPEGTEQALEGLIADGAGLVFATSFGQQDGAVAVAERYPNVKFEHCSGYMTAPNLAQYFARMYQASYLAGMAAGGVTQANKIGYVAAFNFSVVVRVLNAFTLGVRNVNPDATVYVHFSGAWYLPEKSGDIAQGLIDNQGVDVIAQYQDSLAPLLTAKENGIYAVGHHSETSPFAPNTVIASTVWNWGPYYAERIKAVQDGSWASHTWWGSMADNAIELGELGDVVPDDIKQAIQTKQTALKDGSWDVFTGEFHKADGTVWAADGASLTDAELLEMTDFVKGLEDVTPPAPSE